jgi:2'-5' RNA ligase
MLEELQGMGSAVKVVDLESTHVTLKFLGDTPIASVPEIAKRMATVANELDAFELELMGTGAFPHWGRPQVVWVGLSPKEALQNLAARLENDLEPLGFPKESRAYHPHLTLARIKARPPKDLKSLADEYEKTSFGTQTIDRVILYQSVLQKRGPIYTPLATVPFGGKKSSS